MGLRFKRRGRGEAILGQIFACTIGVGAIVATEMLARIRDLLTDGMNPIEDIEE